MSFEEALSREFGYYTLTKAERREMTKFFKVNIRTSFWGSKVEYVERDRPLTDEELNAYED